MNWGKGLVLTLITFGGLMTWLVVKSIQNPEPLVTEQYYEQELKYQQRIDNTERANALSANVSMVPSAQGVRITFPPEAHSGSITGVLTLLRPNDPLADRQVIVAADTTGIFDAVTPGLVAGRYNALLEWSANGIAYYTEEKLVVP
ncbi:MAG: FixH family protein [Flavobacteriales bacterium]|nr:FixH family protein [Flavobacteriales bacterium]MBK7556379.1 FixH family protein [Flavobacteriales bacterium]MBK9193652.1 FixH family protein [Flavobacteriales bacterium]MBP6574443.1 FixH family protein [Flavobacteriales bacterium]